MKLFKNLKNGVPSARDGTDVEHGSTQFTVKRVGRGG